MATSFQCETGHSVAPIGPGIRATARTTMPMMTTIPIAYCTRARCGSEVRNCQSSVRAIAAITNTGITKQSIP